MNFSKAASLIILFSLILSPSKTQAASLLAACSSNSTVANCPRSKLVFPIYAKSGERTPFKFKVDPSGLGEIDGDTAFSSTISALALWEAESNLDFQQVDGGKFSKDINKSNYSSILNPSSSLGFSPIIFDADGAITDDLFGKGSKTNVLGFAGAVFFSSEGSTITGIKESQAVFNGYLYDRKNVGGTLATILDDFQTTILHEFGHTFGMDHTQGPDLDGFNAGTADLTDIPIMFPIAGNPLVELMQDDIASVREAYPAGNENSLYGRIEGKLLKNGSPIKGANLIAFKIDDDNPRKRAVACPSDIDGSGLGTFTLPNLVPGTYIIKAEPLDSDFVDASSVGIHSPIDATRMTTGFYKGDKALVLATNSLDTGISEALQLNIVAGETTNIAFDIGNDPSGSNGDISFLLDGRAINMDKGVFLNTFRSKTLKLKITNLHPGQTRTVRLSTDYPDLIQFLPSDTISFKKDSKQVQVRFAGFFAFADAISELNDQGSTLVPLRVEDLGTGYVNSNEGFLLF